MKNQLNLSNKIIICLIVLIFIFPAFIFKDGSRILYVFLAGIISWTMTRNLLIYLKEKPLKKRGDYNLLLRDMAIFAYLLVYILFSVLINYNNLQSHTLTYLLKIIVTSFILFAGLFSVRTKKAWVRGFPLTKKAAVIIGIMQIILAILSLLSDWLIKNG